MSEKEKRPYTGKWYAKRNERRKERYHSDPEYRAKENQAAREGYRKAAGTETPHDPRDCLGSMSTIGSIRKMVDSGQEEMTFSKAEMATIFNRPVKQIRKWVADGRLPGTVRRAMSESEIVPQDCYTEAEARAMVVALGPFLSELLYFRRDHTDAIKAVYEAIDAVRSEQ